MEESQRLTLIDLAVYYRNEALTCADAGAFHAACMMVGVALEGVLLATALTLEDELRAENLWPEKNGSPERWSLDTLLQLASEARWFAPSTDDVPLAGAVKELKSLRNLAAHPGRHIRDAGGLELEEALARGAFAALEATFDATLALVKPNAS